MMNMLIIVAVFLSALPESRAACDNAMFTTCITDLSTEFSSASSDIPRLCSLAANFQSSAQGCLSYVADCDQAIYNAYATSIVDPSESLGSLCQDNQQPTNTGEDDSCVLTVAFELLGCVDDMSSFAGLASQLGNLDPSSQSVDSYCGLVSDGSIREILSCMAPLIEKCPALLAQGGADESMDFGQIDAQLSSLEAVCNSDCPNSEVLIGSGTACLSKNDITGQSVDSFVDSGSCSKINGFQDCMENTFVDCKDLYGVAVATMSSAVANGDTTYLQSAMERCNVSPSPEFAFFDPTLAGSSNGVIVSLATFFFCLLLTFII